MKNLFHSIGDEGFHSQFLGGFILIGFPSMLFGAGIMQHNGLFGLIAKIIMVWT